MLNPKLMFIKKEWEKIMDELENVYELDRELKDNIPFLRYRLYIEGYTCDYYIVMHEGKLHFVEQDKEENSFILPSWNEKEVKEKMVAYFEKIKKKKRIKNTLHPPRYFFNKQIDKIRGNIENREKFDEIRDYAYEQLLTRYTPHEVEQLAKKETEEENSFSYYMNGINYLLCKIIDVYILVEEKKRTSEYFSFLSLEEAEKEMERKISQTISEEIQRRNIFRA
jgi:hypothetical protein